MIPRLSLRTEFSFRRAYGRVKSVAERCAAIGVTHAAIYDDDGTWGHVDWEKYALASGLEPLFGTRFAFPGEGDRRPSSGVLATDSSALYRLSSAYPFEPERLAERTGFVSFAGNALSDPELFDYIDINQLSRIAIRRSLELHKRTGKPLVLMPHNDYPAPEDRAPFLAWDDSKRMVTQHIMDDEELLAAFSFLDSDVLSAAVKNTYEVAERCSGVRLKRAPMIHVDGDLRAIVEEGRQYRLVAGHIKEWTREYQERLDYELSLIIEKEYESYFLVVGDMVRWAKTQMLVGPARGSSAGSLVCYLTRITEVDPLVHKLLFERFIDLNRADLPDIDIDFNDEKRHLVFEYMAEKYGKDNTARLGNISKLQSRSVIHHVTKKMSIPSHEAYNVINVLIEHSSGDARYGKGLEDTLIGTQPGRDFMRRYPEAQVMCNLEHHASHTSVHAAGLLVSHEPVIDYCTVRQGVAQIDKKAAEELNLLKIDALGLRTLGVIEDTGCITAEELYGLDLADQKVFDIINHGKFAGVFQFEGSSQRRLSVNVPIDSFRKIDHVTALARPGPFGSGGAKLYVERNMGRQAIEYIHPSMGAYLDDTQGVVIYQEQLMRLVREIGNFDWAKTSIIRKGMSASKGPEFFQQYTDDFIAGAVTHGIPEDVAQQMFYDFRMMGSWTMNASHTCSYAVISYWCAYMKAYHPMEYAAALLRNAKDDGQTIETLRELKDEGIEVIAFDPMLSQENWQVIDGKIIGGFRNIVGVGAVKAATLLELREKGELSSEKIEKILKKGVKFTELHPTKALWKDLYENPTKHNINSKPKEFCDIDDGETAVAICRIERIDRRDENESVRVGKRGGKPWVGESLFLDIFVTDDSVIRPVLLRVRPGNWSNIGLPIADKAVPGKDWLMVRGRWMKELQLMIVKKAKCLTNEEMFD